MSFQGTNILPRRPRHSEKKEGIEIGEAQGMAKGREEGAIQIAIAMLKDNIGFESIAQYTQLPIETIKKLS